MVDTWVSYPNPRYSGSAAPSLTLYENEQMLTALGPYAGFLDFDGNEPASTGHGNRAVRIHAGTKGGIRGTHFEFLADTDVPISNNASTQTRIDLVVCRLRRGLSAPDANDAYTIDPYVIEGVPASTPATPNHVRNMLDGSSGFWDLPVRKVTVAPGSGNLSAADSKHQGWWMSGSGYICLSSSRPPVEPGVLLREHDTGITYIGTTGGEWLRQYTHIGPVHFTERTGWKNLSWAFVRTGNLTTMSMKIQRTGNQITDAVEFGDLVSDMRPPETWWGTYECTLPDHAGDVAITKDGKVIVQATPSKPINTNATLTCNMTWPNTP